MNIFVEFRNFYEKFLQFDWRDISKLSNNFEILLVVFMPSITTNHSITYTNVIII